MSKICPFKAAECVEDKCRAWQPRMENDRQTRIQGYKCYTGGRCKLIPKEDK